jgi:hypothetical protein
MSPRFGDVDGNGSLLLSRFGDDRPLNSISLFEDIRIVVASLFEVW